MAIFRVVVIIGFVIGLGFKVFCQVINPVQLPPYNLRGTLNGKIIFVHILDNRALAKENYYYFAEHPAKKIQLFIEPVPRNLAGKVFDVWREEREGMISGYFLLTTFPKDLAIQGIWIDAQNQNLQYPFELKHSLNLIGTIQERSIRMRLDFQGVNASGKALYRGIYWFRNENTPHYVEGVLDYQKGFDILIEEDAEGNFIAFFEFLYQPSAIIWHSADGLQNHKVVLYY